MVALGTGAVSVWLGYSLLQRHYLNRGDFLAMQLLAETREPDGNMASMIPKLSRLATVSPDAASIDKLQFLAGNYNSSFDSSPLYKCGDSLFVRPAQDKTSYSLFGYRPHTKQPLRQLVQQHTRAVTIYDDVETRFSYMEGIREACPLDPTVVNATSVLKGAYTFCFRDYVNAEELNGMMIPRKGIEMLSLRLLHSDQLVVKDDMSCQLTELGVILLGIPVEIRWDGHLTTDRIKWTSTMVRLGWQKFGKTFPNPSVSEKLRQNPWMVRLPKEDCIPTLQHGRGDVVVLHRLGSGSLVFCRDECLNAA